jgi:hypothetical protein
MIKFIEILKEAKQVGDIYHFTSIDNLTNMLKEYKSITLDDNYSSEAGEGYFSFTRNPNIPSLSNFQKQVRLKLDGNKMSNKYKFEPYADTSSSFDYYKQGKNFESEERISAKNNPTIDLTPYIESVVLISIEGVKKEYPKSSSIFKYVINDYKSIIKWFKTKGIPVTFSDKETTTSNRR